MEEDEEDKEKQAPKKVFVNVRSPNDSDNEYVDCQMYLSHLSEGAKKAGAAKDESPSESLKKAGAATVDSAEKQGVATKCSLEEKKVAAPTVRKEKKKSASASEEVRYVGSGSSESARARSSTPPLTITAEVKVRTTVCFQLFLSRRQFLF